MTSGSFRVLVPLDGSTLAERALEAALPLVKAKGGEINLLSVVLRESVDPPPDLDKYHKGLRDRLEWEGVKADARVRLGDPGTDIVAFARERGADLIAMTSHGRSGLRRLLMGSVTEEVLRTSEIPLLVTTPDAKVKFGPRILVPLDGSERAEEALADAVRMARTLDAEVDLLKVVLPVVSAGGLGEVPLLYPTENPRPYLDRMVDRLKAEGVKARAVAATGRAAEEIVRHAEVSGIGLICMTTHGRTGLARLLLGSVAEEILRKAPCPVFVRRKVGTPEPADSRS